jgi:hypothetical protein
MPRPGSELISFMLAKMTKRGINNKGKGIPMPATKTIVKRLLPRNFARLRIYDAGADRIRIMITDEITTSKLFRKYDPIWREDQAFT